MLPDAPVLLWGMPHGGEWLIIAFIALLLFGTRLPAVARSMGRGITEFKRGLKEGESDDDDGDDRDKDGDSKLKSPPKDDYEKPVRAEDDAVRADRK